MSLFICPHAIPYEILANKTEKKRNNFFLKTHLECILMCFFHILRLKNFTFKVFPYILRQFSQFFSPRIHIQRKKKHIQSLSVLIP